MNKDLPLLPLKEGQKIVNEVDHNDVDVIDKGIFYWLDLGLLCYLTYKTIN